MTIITESISIKAPIDKVFDLYVNRIDEWWPRQGEHYRYTFAPKGINPDRIRFEPKEGGRFYETFANGDEYIIGTIKEFSPPSKITYSWKDPDWEAETLIEVSLEETGDETTLTWKHSGFEKLEQPGLAAGYHEGSIEILGILKEWLTAQIPID